MFRKLALTLAAVAALGTLSVAATSTPAEAKWGWKKHHHFHFGHYGFYRPYYAGCYIKKVVYTPWGPRVRIVNVCY
jgi:hypothetical protein